MKKGTLFSAELLNSHHSPVPQLHGQSWEWSVDLTKAPPSSTPSLPSPSETGLQKHRKQAPGSLFSHCVFLATRDARPSITRPKHVDSCFLSLTPVFSHYERRLPREVLETGPQIPFDSPRLRADLHSGPWPDRTTSRHTCDRFMLMYGKNPSQYCKVIIL